MWPELQQWWHRMMGNAQSMPLQAPATYQDSIETITGHPRLGLHYVPTSTFPVIGHPDAAGLYSPNVDAAIIDRSEPQDRRDWILAHELGHRYDVNRVDPGIRQAYDSASVASPYAGAFQDKNDAETFAETFARAMTTLRQTQASKLTPKDAKDWVQSADMQMPGSAAIIKKILESSQLYANHPLHQYLPLISRPLTGPVAIRY